MRRTVAYCLAALTGILPHGSYAFLGVPISRHAFSLSGTKPRTIHRRRQRTNSALHVALGDDRDANLATRNRYALSTQEITQQVVTQRTRRSYIWLAPPTLAASAFCLYDDTAKWFHQCLDWASGNSWVPVDGGKYVAEVTKSALSGPVTFSVSILFGTLVGLTISTLRARQATLQHLFVQLHQEGQEMQQLLQECPHEIRQEGLSLLTSFLHRIDQTLRVPDKSTDAALRQGQELTTLTRLFHQQGDQIKKGVILAEIFASLGRIKSCRVELQSAYTNNFAPAHYANMCVLALALLFIFLLQTDNGTMQFLIDFQLSICWALLIGAYSLLAAVIIDLRSIPAQLSTRLDQDAMLDELLLPSEERSSAKEGYTGQDGFF